MPDDNVVTAVSQRGFSLATLMLMVTLVSVVLGLSTVAPGLGLATAVVALPAFVHTAVTLRHKPENCRSNMFAYRMAEFGSSLSLVLVIGMTAGVCCYATCWPGFFIGSLLGQLWEKGTYAGLGTGFVVGCISGGIVACVVLYLGMTRVWPPRHQSLSSSEKAALAGSIVLSVLGGFVFFFGWLM